MGKMLTVTSAAKFQLLLGLCLWIKLLCSLRSLSLPYSQQLLLLLELPLVGNYAYDYLIVKLPIIKEVYLNRCFA